MLELVVLDNEGKEVEKITVDEALFGGVVNKKLLQELSVMYQANQRQGTASTKDRGEVEGSTKKPWKQKHTGRARAGTIRSPIWRHGGVVFGPKPRSFYHNIPQQLRHKALDSALLSKFIDKETIIINVLSLSTGSREGQAEKPKTKDMVATLKNIGINAKETKAKNKCLLGIKKADRALTLSCRNIPGVKLVPVTDLNAYDVLRYQRLLLTKDAMDYLISARQSQPAGQIEAKQ
jgi:large subunit ribosomal protein L4